MENDLGLNTEVCTQKFTIDIYLKRVCLTQIFCQKVLKSGLQEFKICSEYIAIKLTNKTKTVQQNN